ncbi:unnamed protein product [Prorocentrum cordatum]|uniref:Uncharacterized protein n=1 Tax=Prorocentrum cordatum TaxID=2364126 RepID=A0ABN9QQY5_9DINO|nr:unnamed protein product [Polarella glacialis]
MPAISRAVVLPENLGTSFGHAHYAPGFAFGEALQHVENLKANDHPRINASRLETAGPCTIADLPAQFGTECGKMIQHFEDYLGDYEGEVPRDTLRERAKARDFEGVPEPFSLKMEPPGQCSMQVVTVRKPDGKHDILKDSNLLGVLTSTDSCLQMCCGTGLGWRYGNLFRVGRLTAQRVLACWRSRGGVYQLRYHTVAPKAGRGAARKTAWSAAYRWVRRKCGGRMPSHCDRQQWRDLIAELQWRALAATQTSDGAREPRLQSLRACSERRGDVFRRPVEADSVSRSRCSYCKQVRECWQVRDLPSFARSPHCAECWEYYEDWLFSDLAGFAGLLPEGPLVEPLQPVGMASVAVFPPGRRPCGSDRNVAMVYAIGPNCGGRRKKGRREQDDLSKQDFLAVLEVAGGAIAAAVAAHNAGAEEERLPPIDVLRMCLLSGGVYKHPGASKVWGASEGPFVVRIHGVARQSLQGM